MGLAREIDESVLEVPVPELSRSFFAAPGDWSFVIREVAEQLGWVAGLLFAGSTEWSCIESRIRSNLRFLVSMAYIPSGGEMTNW